MLVAVDIGNTNIVLGFHRRWAHRGHLPHHHESEPHVRRIRADDHAVPGVERLQPPDVDDVIISSVVPKVMHSFRASIVKFLGIDPMIVGPGVKTGLNIRMDNPQNMGADCIADCAGAYYEYGGPSFGG